MMMPHALMACSTMSTNSPHDQLCTHKSCSISKYTVVWGPRWYHPTMKIIGLVSPQPCLLVKLISCHLFVHGSLKSGTPNFWKTEGAQKVTFSIQNLYSQMHFRSQMCPGGHLEGFEACLKRRSELRTWARKLCFFKGKSKICTTIFTK